MFYCRNGFARKCFHLVINRLWRLNPFQNYKWKNRDDILVAAAHDNHPRICRLLRRLLCNLHHFFFSNLHTAHTSVGASVFFHPFFIRSPHLTRRRYRLDAKRKRIIICTITSRIHTNAHLTSLIRVRIFSYDIHRRDGSQNGSTPSTSPDTCCFSVDLEHTYGVGLTADAYPTLSSRAWRVHSYQAEFLVNNIYALGTICQTKLFLASSYWLDRSRVRFGEKRGTLL